jgi:hypothetical protein
MPHNARRPDLFIIGAAKSGTTSLYEYLKGHPEVFMSASKEPRYFAPDLESWSGHNLRYGKDLERYLALFKPARDEKRLGEASARYIYSREAPALIHAFQPKAYIVAMLRNPVDMAHSLHGELVAEGAEDITDFEQALAAEDDRRRGERVPARRNPRMMLYRERASYSSQLERWFDIFGRDRVHVIIFEDFLREPAAVFRRLLEFLDVDPDYRPPSFASHNVGWAPRSRALQRLARSRLPQWLVWQAMPRVIGEGRARSLVRAYQASPLYRRPQKRVPLDRQLRRRLEQEFAPDVARLSELLGRDLAEVWWQASRREARSAGGSG